MGMDACAGGPLAGDVVGTAMYAGGFGTGYVVGIDDGTVGWSGGMGTGVSVGAVRDGGVVDMGCRSGSVLWSMAWNHSCDENCRPNSVHSK